MLKEFCCVVKLEIRLLDIPYKLLVWPEHTPGDGEAVEDTGAAAASDSAATTEVAEGVSLADVADELEARAPQSGRAGPATDGESADDIEPDTGADPEADRPESQA